MNGLDQDSGLLRHSIMKALIAIVDGDGNKEAIQVVEDEDIFDSHEGMEWMDAPDECESGWKFEDGALVAPPDTGYMRKRAKAYPSIQDQLDYIYHNGIAKWKSDMVKPVKDAHPKP